MNRKEVDPGDDGGEKAKVVRLREGLAKLGECETKGDIYDTTLRTVGRILDCDFRLLCLKDENTLMAKGELGEYGNEGPAQKVMGADLSTRTLKKETPIRGEDPSPYFEGKTFYEECNSFLSVPIGSLGTLQVYSHDKGKFSELDVNFLRILASHLRERLARAKLEGEVRQQAIHDQLTGLYNRHYLDEILAKEVQRARRYDHRISFLMLDVNGFKEVNDRYSHAKGDRVLKEIGKVLDENVREVDTVFRYGGDEFLILLPETGEGSRMVAGRLKEAIKTWSEVTEELDFPLTIAIGSSNLEPNEKIDVEKKISEADRKMYADKNGVAG
ncbi:sensor domain-containing diguanylate cyclase [Candidatus Bipolaricaulota bacterium]|nr:sensor domain-containing diguanylate cyclase [Candidatus Bipolaricaulota bacterium]